SRRRHTRFSRDWSSDVCSSDLIVEGLVSPAHRGPSAELRAALAAWPHVHYWGAADHAELVLVRPVAPRRQEAWLLHLVLFAVTEIGRASCREIAWRPARRGSGQ